MSTTNPVKLVFGQPRDDCKQCKGSGEVQESYDGIAEWVGCPRCKGTGVEPLPEATRDDC